MKSSRSHARKSPVVPRNAFLRNTKLIPELSSLSNDGLLLALVKASGTQPHRASRFCHEIRSTLQVNHSLRAAGGKGRRACKKATMAGLAPAQPHVEESAFPEVALAIKGRNTCQFIPDFATSRSCRLPNVVFSIGNRIKQQPTFTGGTLLSATLFRSGISMDHALTRLNHDGVRFFLLIVSFTFVGVVKILSFTVLAGAS
jgi:hypothetical protein